MTWLTRFAQISKGELEHIPTNTDFTKDSVAGILQIVFALIGAASLFILIITAIKFQIALGDSSKIAKARNSVIYAAIGLAVSVMAFSIVSLVLRGVT